MQSLEAGYTYRTVNRALVSVASDTRASQQKNQQNQKQLFLLLPRYDQNHPQLGGVQRTFRDSVFSDACLAFAEIKRYASIFLGVSQHIPNNNDHNKKLLLLGCILNFADVFRLGDEWRHIVVIWLYEVGLLPRVVCKTIMDFLIICP